MPAVALDLLRLQRAVLHHRQAGLGPLLEAALEVRHVVVAQVLEGLGRQHRAQTALAVQHDGRRGVGGGAADAELEKAPADVGRGLDEAVAILVGIADVDEHQRLARVDPLLDLGRALLGNHRPGLRQHLLERFHVLLLGRSLCNR